MRLKCKSFPFNIVSTLLASTGVALFKFHNLTTFHVFTLLFFFIVFLLMYIERQERRYREKRKYKQMHRVSKQIRQFFDQRANVLSAGVVWFYITYSILAKDVYFARRNQVITNLLSASFVVVAVGASLYRKRFVNGIQEKIMVVYVLLLCFPMNLLQHTLPVVVGLRMLIFFLVFNLELYVGKTLDYRTTYKHLVLCSYFAFTVNEWYLVSAVPIILTHFLEIQRQVKRKAKKSRQKVQTFVETESVSSYFLSSNSDFDSECSDLEVQQKNSTGKPKSQHKTKQKLNSHKVNSNLFLSNTSGLGPTATESEEIKFLLQQN